MERTADRVESRRGIAAGGNWIVDRIKTVDALPGRGMLANSLCETRSPGGAPANVLADLARLQAPFPLAGVGRIGDDADGRFILERFAAHGVDLAALTLDPTAPTAYTDVMTETASGARTFFHHRGANARFAPEDIPFDRLSCRIFHLGYLLLLDAMDRPDPDCGTVAARALRTLRQRGIKTSVDVVSEESDRFRTLVPPALPHVDYLILNEIEAGRITGRRVRRADDTLDACELAAAMDALGNMGNMEVLAVHLPEGACVQDRRGRRQSVGSLKLPDGFIVSSVGAGDAFCAGMLYGLHEGWDAVAAADLACCCAAASLAAPGASEGIPPLSGVVALGARWPRRPPPLS